MSAFLQHSKRLVLATALFLGASSVLWAFDPTVYMHIRGLLNRGDVQESIVQALKQVKKEKKKWQKKTIFNSRPRYRNSCILWSILFIPTSITVAPSFTISSVTNFAFPIAAINISACLVISFKFLVFEWHTVTVAFLFKQHCINGFPTILLLPIITVFAPSVGILYSSNISLENCSFASISARKGLIFFWTEIPLLRRGRWRAKSED